MQWGARDGAAATRAVIDQSEGVFLWIRFQERAIRELARTSLGITPASVATLAKGMKNVYAKYFADLLAALGGDETRYRGVVSLALLAPRAPPPVESWREALGMGVDAFRATILAPTSRLLMITDDEVKPPHKSMLDWLTAPVEDKSGARGMGPVSYTHLTLPTTPYV